MMKQILGIVVLGLLLSGNAFAFGSVIGKGEITLSKKTAAMFIAYLRSEISQTFIISKDGKYSNYSICHSLKWSNRSCAGGKGSTPSLIKSCKKATGMKCYTFAMKKGDKKIIRWNEDGYEFDLKQQQSEYDWIIKILKNRNFY